MTRATHTGAPWIGLSSRLALKEFPRSSSARAREASAHVSTSIAKANSNDNNVSLQWYDGFLQRGDEVAVTGGSDSHWVTTDAAQGVGEPTTWVYVRPAAASLTRRTGLASGRVCSLT